MSVLRTVGERKRKKRLGEVNVIGVEQYGGLELDAKIELVRSLIPLGLMHVHELLDEEVMALAGERYGRKEDRPAKIYRHGANPGSVRMAGQRVPIKVPRLRDGGQEVSLASYAALSGPGELDEQLLRRVLHGISCRNYEEAAEAIPGAIGLSPPGRIERLRQGLLSQAAQVPGTGLTRRGHRRPLSGRQDLR